MNRLSEKPKNAEILKSVIVGHTRRPINFQKQDVVWYKSDAGPILFCKYEPSSLGKAYKENFSWYLLSDEGSAPEILSEGANWIFLR